MAVEVIRDRFQSKVGEVVLGATPEEGGTRGKVIKIGGDATLPFHHFEGEMGHPPVIALEVVDMEPDWNESLKEPFADVIGDPAAWAQKAVEEYGADLIFLRLSSAHPDNGDASPDACAETLKKVLEAVDVPLIVVGSGEAEKDNQVMPVVAEAGAGENLLLGTAEEDNYKTLTAACMVHKHSIIANSPIDINICKQLNILIHEMNQPLNRIVIDPTAASLGYGIEYVYSIMERMRLGALAGDKMLSMPILLNVGYEAWRQKEANVSDADFPAWGPRKERAILWEAMTATTLLMAGAHLLVMRHPEAVRKVRKAVEGLLVPNKYE